MKRWLALCASGLASVRLTIGLLVTILGSCLFGALGLGEPLAGEWIFRAIWFQLVLTLLVVNTVFCFFTRMWGKRLTLTLAGMVLFHLSFIGIFGGVVYNSQAYFYGTLRMAEGETLPNAGLENYDSAEHGRWFALRDLQGTTRFRRLHLALEHDGQRRVPAYEVAQGEAGNEPVTRYIYTLHPAHFHGVRFYNDKEGYALVTVVADREGRPLHGAQVPLQSLRDTEDRYFYTYGTKTGARTLPFPQDASAPALHFRVQYHPDPRVERSGEVTFKVWKQHGEDSENGLNPDFEGRVPVGRPFAAGDYQLAVQEVRYWVGMTVRYDPGHPIVLTSLWVAFAGIVLTFVGRLRQRRRSVVGRDRGEAADDPVE